MSEMTKDNVCYFDNCPDHISPTPPTDPRPTYQGWERVEDHQRRQYCYDRTPPTMAAKRAWRKAQKEAAHLDLEDLQTYLWEYAETTGIAWWSQTKKDWVLR